MASGRLNADRRDWNAVPQVGQSGVRSQNTLRHTCGSRITHRIVQAHLQLTHDPQNWQPFAMSVRIALILESCVCL